MARRCCCCRCRYPGWIRELEARSCTITAIVSFTFAVTSFAVFSDSALQFLQADLTSTTCTVSRTEDVFGITNCSWTSCSQSCTAELYACKHIYVSYFPEKGKNSTNNNIYKVFNNTTHEYMDINSSTIDALDVYDDPEPIEVALLVNIRACGYEPEVNCPEFFRIYTDLYSSFNCQIGYDHHGVSFAVPTDIEAQFIEPEFQAEYLIYTIVPLILCIVSLIWIKIRKLYRMRKKKDSKISSSKGKKLKTFYEKKISEKKKHESAKEKKAKAKLQIKQEKQLESNNLNEVVILNDDQIEVPLIRVEKRISYEALSIESFNLSRPLSYKKAPDTHSLLSVISLPPSRIQSSKEHLIDRDKENFF